MMLNVSSAADTGKPGSTIDGSVRSESASRALVSVEPACEDRLLELAAGHGVPCARLGETGGPRVVAGRSFDAPVAELRDAYERALPELLGEAV